MCWPCQQVRRGTCTDCVHTTHQKNPFQSKQSKHFHQENQFTQYEIGPNKVKLPKVGPNVMVPVPVGAGPNKYGFSDMNVEIPSNGDDNA